MGRGWGEGQKTKKKDLQEALQILEIIGAEGQNRTVDTGIFRPRLTICEKPMIPDSKLFSLAFYVLNLVGKC